MKKIALIAALLVSQTAISEIKGSTFEERHQNIIEKAIVDICGLRGTATLVSNSEKVVSIDQGIHDVYFMTELNVQVRTDQYSTADYKVVVESVLSDAYDHSSQKWGAYYINSMTCDLK